MQSFIWSPSKQRLDLRWRWVLHCELPPAVPKHHEGHAPKSRLFSNIPLETRGGRQKLVFIAPFAWRVLRVWRHACIFPALYFSGKGKVTLFNVGSSFSYETGINGSRRCALYPLPLSVLRFTGIQSYGYMDQRKVEADVEVTEDRTGDLSLRKPRTSQLSHDCF